MYKKAEFQWFWNITTNIEDMTQNVKDTINTGTELTFVSGVWGSILLTMDLKWLWMSLGPIAVYLQSFKRALGALQLGSRQNKVK